MQATVANKLVARWDPLAYELGERYRQISFDQLIRLVPLLPRKDGMIVDLGCGHGRRSSDLVTRFDSSLVLGIDASEAMLREALHRAIIGRLAFEMADLTTWKSDGLRPITLIISHSALHLVANHHVVIPRLMRMLTSDGVIAVAMPLIFQTKIPEIAATASYDPQFIPRTEGFGFSQKNVMPLAWYRETMRTEGFEIVTAMDLIHSYQVRAGELYDWMSGSLLRPLLMELSIEDQSRFFERFKDEVLSAYAIQDQYSPFEFGLPVRYFVGRRSV